MRIEHLNFLNKHGYSVSVENDGKIIRILRKKGISKILGIVVLIIGIISCLSGVLYLAFNEDSGFHPWLFRALLASGMFLFLVGLGVRNAKGEDDTHIDLDRKTLAFGSEKRRGEQIRRTYSFSEISNPEVLKFRKKYLLVVQIKTEKSKLFELSMSEENNNLLNSIRDDLDKLFQ